MNYEIANIPTLYRFTLFRSRLEARWAAFADLAGWKWKYEPVDLKGWIPDFWFGIPCGHSECCSVPAECCPRCASPRRETFNRPVMEYINGKATGEALRNWTTGSPITQPLYRCLDCANEYLAWRRDPNFLHELYAEVKPYLTLEEFEGHPVTLINEWETPSPARFGVDPSVTEWTMTHGSGGGVESAVSWIATDWNWEDAWSEAGNRTRYRRRS